MIDAGRLKAHMYDVVGALRAVHGELGPGLNEYCYQEGFAIEMGLRNIPFEREKSFHPVYKGQPMSVAYRLDFLCKGDIVVECKAVEELTTVMRAQLFNYMRLLRARVASSSTFPVKTSSSSATSTMPKPMTS